VGQASVGSSHLPANRGDGKLTFFGLEVRIDGALISPTKSFTITRGVSHTVEIRATNEDFKGFLIAASSASGANLADAVIPDATTGQVSDKCASPVGGITHKDNLVKKSASGTLLVDAVTDVRLDVTVVLRNSGGVSSYGWAQYRGTVSEGAASNPTKAPAKPVAPVPPPTSPVKPPTRRPTLQPVAPAPSPVRTPRTQGPATKRPTLKPIYPTAAPKKPTRPPQRPPTDSPASRPSRKRTPTASPTRQPSTGGGVVVRGWGACLAKVRRRCPCQRRKNRSSRNACAARVIGRSCSRVIRARQRGSTGIATGFARQVRRKFREYCRRENRNDGDRYYRFEDG
jgi:hypothetical protein